MCLLTNSNSVISAVEKFCERRSGSLLLNHDSSLLVSSQLTQHACCHSLNVLYLVVEQLDKDGDDGESSDDGSVVLLPGQDVEGAHGALHYLLHPSSPCQRRSQKPSIPVCCECQLPVCPGMLG